MDYANLYSALSVMSTDTESIVRQKNQKTKDGYIFSEVLGYFIKDIQGVINYRVLYLKKH